MAIIGNTYLTLADRFKRENPDSSIATVIELLSETNEILQEAVTLEANDGSSHLTTVRTGIPAGTWRKLYQGVQKEKSTTQQVRDTTGMLEAYSEVDKDLVDKSRQPARFRLSEAMAFLEGLGQTFATTFFYGDTDADPEKFMGLAPRFNAISADQSQSGYNIIDGGGSGSDNTSVWIIKWGENTCHLIYPRGSKAGIQHTDKGQVTIEDASNNPFEAYRDHFKWDVGMSLRDWRAVSRVANVDVSDLKAGTVAIDDLMLDAWFRVRRRPGRAAIYANEAVHVALHKKAKDKANVNLAVREFAGQEIVTFLGTPIRLANAITETEAQVV